MCGVDARSSVLLPSPCWAGHPAPQASRVRWSAPEAYGRAARLRNGARINKRLSPRPARCKRRTHPTTTRATRRRSTRTAARCAHPCASAHATAARRRRSTRRRHRCRCRSDVAASLREPPAARVSFTADPTCEPSELAMILISNRYPIIVASAPLALGFVFAKRTAGPDQCAPEHDYRAGLRAVLISPTDCGILQSTSKPGTHIG